MEYEECIDERNKAWCIFGRNKNQKYTMVCIWNVKRAQMKEISQHEIPYNSFLRRLQNENTLQVDRKAINEFISECKYSSNIHHTTISQVRT